MRINVLVNFFKVNLIINKLLFLKKDFHAKTIEWKRQDGESMLPNVDLTRKGFLTIHDLSEENLGVYECHVRNSHNKLIKKRININFFNRIDNKYHHSKNHYYENSNKLPPTVRIVPIHMDVREGGRIELECESG